LHTIAENLLIVPPAKAGKLFVLYFFLKKSEFYLDNGWLGCFRRALALENTQDRTHYFTENLDFTLAIFF